jgi:TetR/AcrR family transcriptional regulator
VKIMGLAERRQRERDKRREEIITATSKLFSKKGYENVSMEEIANEVELSKSTLYFYFKDKNSLFLAVLNHGNKILNDLLAEDENIQSKDIKVGGYKSVWFRFVREYPEYARCRAYFGKVKFGLEIDKSRNDEEKEILEFNKGCFEKGIEDFKTGIEKGLYRQDLNPFLITALSFLLYDSLFTIDPWLKEILDANGTTVEQFIMNSVSYLDFLILNR